MIVQEYGRTLLKFQEHVMKNFRTGQIHGMVGRLWAIEVTAARIRARFKPLDKAPTERRRLVGPLRSLAN